MSTKFKAIVLYGDEAYEAMANHEDERWDAETWVKIYSEELGYKPGDYNPIEILEFDTREEMETATEDPGTSMMPKYYQTERIFYARNDQPESVDELIEKFEKVQAETKQSFDRQTKEISVEGKDARTIYDEIQETAHKCITETVNKIIDTVETMGFSGDCYNIPVCGTISSRNSREEVFMEMIEVKDAGTMAEDCWESFSDYADLVILFKKLNENLTQKWFLFSLTKQLDQDLCDRLERLDKENEKEIEDTPDFEDDEADLPF